MLTCQILRQKVDISELHWHISIKSGSGRRLKIFHCTVYFLYRMWVFTQFVRFFKSFHIKSDVQARSNGWGGGGRLNMRTLPFIVTYNPKLIIFIYKHQIISWSLSYIEVINGSVNSRLDSGGIELTY